MKDPRFYDYAEVHSVPRLRVRVISSLLVLAAFAGFFWLAWYAYKSGTSNGQIEDVPVVEADNEPYRVAPTDPGGMEIPHRDKTVYETLNHNDDGGKQEEKISPKPEEPVVQNPDVDAEKLAAERAAALQQVESAKPEREVLKPDNVTKSAPVKTEEKAVEPVKQEAPATTAKTETKKQVAEKPRAAVAVKAGTVRVQLGAFRTSAEAEQSWASLTKKYNGTIGKSDHGIEKADVPGKGTFYRLQVINIGSADDARSLCKKLSAQKQGCFIVK